MDTVKSTFTGNPSSASVSLQGAQTAYLILAHSSTEKVKKAIHGLPAVSTPALKQ